MPQANPRRGATARRHLVLGAAALLAAAPRPGKASSCGGPITPNGQRLAAFLDRTRVDMFWDRGWHVDWLTGEHDRPNPGGREATTHCSAFAAAVGYRLGVYLLRPPEHPQELLANAQLRWLAEAGTGAGWMPVGSVAEAQGAANRGDLAVAAFLSPDPRRAGHIAVLRPGAEDCATLAAEGPQVTQAGHVNALSIAMRDGFSAHPGAWASGGTGTARFFVHAVDWSRAVR